MLRNASSNYDDYLASLNMSLTVEVVRKSDIDRVFQLINKTNQFNINGIRVAREQLDEFIEDSDYKIIAVKLEDKFSSYGVVSSIILRRYNQECTIDTWVMSCRVFNREIEKEVINRLVVEAEKWNVNRIIGEYIPTNKNDYVKDVFLENGFNKIWAENKKYELVLSKFETIHTVFNGNTSS